MERFDLYNKSGVKINKTINRGDKTLENEYYKVVHLWIKNSKNQYLIQQRNKSTDLFPYQWAPTAGACISGEQPIESVIREVKEEIGYSFDLSEIRFLHRFFVERKNYNFIIEMFIVNKDINLKDLVLDYNEVKDVKYSSFNDIMTMIENNEFWDFKTIAPKYMEILERDE
ncbi:MAG: NUDIX domain-containing protein [Candidatus Izemoplasmatales bacterium]